MLTKEQLEELKQFDSPTICNAVEFFDIRPKTQGFMNPSVKKIFVNDKRTVGYACTAKVSALNPPTEAQKKLSDLYYENLRKSPKPSVAVIQDIDPAPIGSFWGEVQATIHRSLGCDGVVTSGGVRDLDEVKNLNFEYYASCLLVSHACIHVEDAGGLVTVGGMTVRPGDLVFADKHGAIVIPEVAAPHLAEACRAAQEAELPVLENCRRHFEDLTDVGDLIGWRAEMNKRRADFTEKFSALVKK